MFLTSKARYVVTGILEMASKDLFALTKLSDIAANQEIELQLLEQIFAKLKKAGLVGAVRGLSRGYRLTRTTQKISIVQIIKSVEEDIKAARCSNNKQHSNGYISSGEIYTAHHLWVNLERQIEKYFANKTLFNTQNRTSFKTPFINKIYFDHNATTNLLPEVREGLLELYQYPLNASSVHANGRAAKHYLENARNQVKELVKADNQYQVVFTASGTEANNLAILGLNINPLVSVIEHPSITNLVKYAVIKVLKNGIVDLEELEQILSTYQGKIPLISVMLANNETGVIQPLQEIVQLAKKKGAIVHTDASQGPGKIPIDIVEMGVDMMTISAHKFGGPLGAAALLYKKQLDLQPIISGGGQEYRVRSGTHNIQAIHGFGIACSLEPKYRNLMSKTESLRNYIEKEIAAISSNAIFFGRDVIRLPNTASIGMPKVYAESQIIHFDINNIAVSNGSACSSGATKIPHVHMAMGYSLEDARTAIRVSLGINNTYEEANKFIQAWQDLYMRSNKLIKNVI